jgi:hypothetical protein
MSYVDIPGRIYWPALWGTGSRANDWSTKTEVVLDGTADRLAFVFHVPKDGTIEGLVFTAGTVTTSQSLDIRLESINPETGHPTGELIATGTSGTQATVASNSQYLVALGTTYAAQAGGKLAFVIQFTSTAGNLAIASGHSNNEILAQIFPYADFNAGAGYGITGVVPNFAVKIDGAYPHCGGLPYKIIAKAEAIDNTVGLRIKIPVTVKVCGIWLRYSSYGGETEGSIAYLRNASDTILGSGVFCASGETGKRGIHLLFFDEAVVLANTVHRITIKSLSSYELGVFYEIITVQSNAYLEAWPGGTEWYFTSGAPGSWSDVTTQRITAMGLIVSAIDVPAAGGGLILNPGVDGGMRG